MLELFGKISLKVTLRHLLYLRKQGVEDGVYNFEKYVGMERNFIFIYVCICYCSSNCRIPFINIF